MAIQHKCASHLKVYFPGGYTTGKKFTFDSRNKWVDWDVVES